jgi:hypothetical protein
MAKDPFRDNADKSGLGRNSDSWRAKEWKDPMGGPGAPKDVQKPSPVGTGLQKSSDSTA